MLDVRRARDLPFQFCYHGDKGWMIATLFFTTAYLAGTKRGMEVMKVSQPQTLYFAAGTASMGLVASHYARPYVTSRKHPLVELVLKCALVFITAKLTTAWLMKHVGKEASYAPADCNKFAQIAVGTVLGGHALGMMAMPKDRRVKLEDLAGDYRAIAEEMPMNYWSFTRDVTQFDPDSILDVVGDDDVLHKKEIEGVPAHLLLSTCPYEELFLVDGKDFLEERIKNQLKRNIARYTSGGRLDAQEEASKWYLNKILGYLILKLRAYQADFKKTLKQKEELQDLIKNTFLAINDAHQNCVDQVLSQIQLIVVDVLDDFGMTELQKGVAVALRKYVAGLIKEVVRETGETHAADLEVSLTRDIYVTLGLPLPRSLQSGAKYAMIASFTNYRRARSEFFRAYKPLEVLVSRCTYHTERKLFAGVGQWFGQNVFTDGLDEAVEKERVAIFGSDFVDWETMDQRKDGAIVYALFKSGCIG
ncbi:MAG: hypothetical protein KDK64_06725 [Chlamydiia bacterium]|nr:hypothetical protein [Chlamydiia bacterium]